MSMEEDGKDIVSGANAKRRVSALDKKSLDLVLKTAKRKPRIYGDWWDKFETAFLSYLLFLKVLTAIFSTFSTNRGCPPELVDKVFPIPIAMSILGSILFLWYVFHIRHEGSMKYIIVDKEASTRREGCIVVYPAEKKCSEDFLKAFISAYKPGKKCRLDIADVNSVYLTAGDKRVKLCKTKRSILRSCLPYWSPPTRVYTQPLLPKAMLPAPNYSLKERLYLADVEDGNNTVNSLYCTSVILREITGDALLDIMLLSDDVCRSKSMLRRYLLYYYGRLTENIGEPITASERIFRELLPRFFTDISEGKDFLADLRRRPKTFRWALERGNNAEHPCIAMLDCALKMLESGDSSVAEISSEGHGTTERVMGAIFAFSSPSHVFSQKYTEEEVIKLSFRFLTQEDFRCCSILDIMKTLSDKAILSEKVRTERSRIKCDVPYFCEKIPGLLRSVDCIVRACIFPESAMENLNSKDVRRLYDFCAIKGFSGTAVGRACVQATEGYSGPSFHSELSAYGDFKEKRRTLMRSMALALAEEKNGAVKNMADSDLAGYVHAALQDGTDYLGYDLYKFRSFLEKHPGILPKVISYAVASTVQGLISSCVSDCALTYDVMRETIRKGSPEYDMQLLNREESIDRLYGTLNMLGFPVRELKAEVCVQEMKLIGIDTPIDLDRECREYRKALASRSNHRSKQHNASNVFPAVATDDKQSSGAPEVSSAVVTEGSSVCEQRGTSHASLL